MKEISESISHPLLVKNKPKFVKGSHRSDINEFWQYKELLYFFIWKDIKVKYKQTSIGIVWAIIQPLLGCGLFTLIFGKFAKIPNNGLPYPLFYFIALLSWTYFSTSLNLSANSVITNSQLISKIYFPRIMLPASSVCGMMLDLSLTVVVLFSLLIYYKINFSPNLFYLILIYFNLFLFTFSIGALLSALVVRYRDIRYALPFVIQIWMFASPVVYPLSIVPNKYKWIALLNPLSGIIETSRSIISGAQIPWPYLYCSIAMTAVIFSLGIWYFKKTERWFADII